MYRSDISTVHQRVAAAASCGSLEAVVSGVAPLFACVAMDDEYATCENPKKMHRALKSVCCGIRFVVALSIVPKPTTFHTLANCIC